MKKKKILEMKNLRAVSRRDASARKKTLARIPENLAPHSIPNRGLGVPSERRVLAPIERTSPPTFAPGRQIASLACFHARTCRSTGETREAGRVDG